MSAKHRFFLLIGRGAAVASTHAQVAALSAPVGPSGGASGNVGAQITSHSVTGHAVGGGVSDTVATIQDKGGYSGQLFDVTSLVIGASPARIDQPAPDRSMSSPTSSTTPPR